MSNSFPTLTDLHLGLQVQNHFLSFILGANPEFFLEELCCDTTEIIDEAEVKARDGLELSDFQKLQWAIQFENYILELKATYDAATGTHSGKARKAHDHAKSLIPSLLADQIAQAIPAGVTAFDVRPPVLVDLEEAAAEEALAA